MYFLRARTLARARRAGAGVAAVVLVRRAGADGGDARLPARAPRRRALPRAHARAPAARRPRRAAARARPHRPAAAARAARAGPALAARLRAPGRRARRRGRRTSTSGTCPRSTRARSSTTPSTRSSTSCSSRSGSAMWMALLGPLPKPAWFGNGAKIGYIVAVRLIQSVLANALLWSGGVLYPRYAAGEALLGHHARQRPERGGRDHDGRGLDRHDPAVLLAVPARGARERGEAGAGRAGGRARRRAQRGARRAGGSAGRGDALRERILSEGPPRVRSSAWSVPSDVRPRCPRLRSGPGLGGTARPPSSTACFSSGPLSRRPSTPSLPAAVWDCWRIHGLSASRLAGGLSPLRAQARAQLLGRRVVGLVGPAAGCGSHALNAAIEAGRVLVGADPLP